MEEDVISNEYSISATEVLDILKYLPENIVSKIPTKFMQFLKDNSIPNYKPKFDYSQGLDKIPLSNKTRALLAMIYRNYICSAEERLKYDKILYQNEEIYQSNLREKYNPNNIFKKDNSTKTINEDNEVSLVELKEENLLKKMIDFFRRILKK